MDETQAQVLKLSGSNVVSIAEDVVKLIETAKQLTEAHSALSDAIRELISVLNTTNTDMTTLLTQIESGLNIPAAEEDTDA